MSRRRAAPKREILPDPKFGSELVTKFMNQVMVSGKKSVAERIVYRALDEVTEKLKDKIRRPVVKDDEEGGDEGSGGTGSGGTGSITLLIFRRVLDNIAPTVEVRSRRVGGSTYQIPMEVRPTRRLTLAMRWLIDAAKKRAEKTMASRLAAEMLAAYNGSGGAVKKRDDTHKMAEANKAFAHYRW